MSKKNKYGDELAVGEKVYIGPSVNSVECWREAGIKDGDDWTLTSFPPKTKSSAIIEQDGRKQIVFLDAIRPVSVRAKRENEQRTHAARTRLSRMRVAIRTRRTKRTKRNVVGR